MILVLMAIMSNGVEKLSESFLSLECIVLMPLAFFWVLFYFLFAFLGLLYDP